MATQNECRACFAGFDSPSELGSHIEFFRRRLFTLTTKIQAIYLSLPLGDEEILRKEDGTPCPICGEQFEQQEELDKHIWAHQSEVFKLSDGIKAAVWHLPALDQGSDDNGGHDDGKDGPFRCPYPQCNVGLNRKSLLTRHYYMHIHCQEVCVICYKQFTQASTYISHVSSHSSRNANNNAIRMSFAKHRASLLQTHAGFQLMTREQRNKNRQETTGQEENVRDVEFSPSKKRRQQEPANQTKRRRGNAQDDTVPSFQTTLPGNLAPDLNHDRPDRPDVEPNPGPCPDPIVTMHSLGGNWDHASGQILPTPPSSSLGVDIAPDPHLSDAYQATFTQFLEPFQDQRAAIFLSEETIPVPRSLWLQESSTFSVYEPTIPVRAGSSACNQVEDLLELNSMRSN